MLKDIGHYLQCYLVARRSVFPLPEEVQIVIALVKKNPVDEVFHPTGSDFIREMVIPLYTFFIISISSFLVFCS